MQKETNQWSSKLTASKKKEPIYQKQLSLVSLDTRSEELDKVVQNRGNQAIHDGNSSFKLEAQNCHDMIKKRQSLQHNSHVICDDINSRSDTAKSDKTIHKNYKIERTATDKMDSYTAGIELSNACRNY